MAKIPQLDIDNIPLSFGKFKGKTPNEICEQQPSYICWMWEEMDDAPCSEDCYERRPK